MKICFNHKPNILERSLSEDYILMFGKDRKPEHI